eukprot:SAG31_NODE_2719_length_5189_cov_4.394029_7_plen_185_part_00
MESDLISQTRIAGDLGVAQTLVSRWLSGNDHVNYERLDRLMAEWLLKHDEKNTQKRKLTGAIAGCVPLASSASVIGSSPGGCVGGSGSSKSGIATKTGGRGSTRPGGRGTERGRGAKRGRATGWATGRVSGRATGRGTRGRRASKTAISAEHALVPRKTMQNRPLSEVLQLFLDADIKLEDGFV